MNVLLIVSDAPYGSEKACGSCANARGLMGLKLLDGVEISTSADPDPKAKKAS